MANRYTKEAAALLRKLFLEKGQEGIKEFCELSGRSKQSAVAKLSSMGFYKTQRNIKPKPITKLEIVRQLEEKLNVQLPQLDKSPRQTLLKLLTVVNSF